MPRSSLCTAGDCISPGGWQCHLGTPPRAAQILCCPEIWLCKNLIQVTRLLEVGRCLLLEADSVSFTALDLITGPCCTFLAGKMLREGPPGLPESSGVQGSLEALKTHRLLRSPPSEVVSTAENLEKNWEGEILSSCEVSSQFGSRPMTLS